jgi:hypothetical protein
MDVVEVERLRDDLAGFTADVFASSMRSGWQDRASWYLHGLMLDGRRKSIQPMAVRLGGVHEQALKHLVTNGHLPELLHLASYSPARIVVSSPTAVCLDGPPPGEET